MVWIVMLLGLTAVIAPMALLRRPREASVREAPLEDELYAHMGRLASDARSRGKARVRLPARMLKRLQKSVRYLNSLPAEEWLPASRWLCDNGRFLQEEILSTGLALRALPPLPRLPDGEARVMRFVTELVGHSNADVSAQRLKRAVETWQKNEPMTVNELRALPICLRLTLLRVVLELCEDCAREQRARAAAVRALKALERGREKEAMRLFRRFEHSGAFLEKLLSAPADGAEGAQTDGLARFFAQPNLLSRRTADAEHEHQSESCLWVSGAVHSLRLCLKLPWHRLLEEMSLVHAALLWDKTYGQMDLESRAYYRTRVMALSQMSRKPELSVIGAAEELCKNGEGVRAHVGYYLLDEGQDDLLLYLQALGFSNRFKRFCAAHACGLSRVGSWLCFAGLLALAYAIGLHPALWIPFGFTFLYAARQTALWAFRRYLRPKLVPRMKIDKLREDQQTLVVCPTMLLSAEHALQMVKQLSTLYYANPDERLHFMLLGDFQDSITGTLSGDDEIVSAASAAVSALQEDTGRAFYYLQRERVYVPRDHVYMSRERKRGSVETLLKLVCGREVEDRFVYASAPPDALRGRYRYVITLDSDTFLPPGGALRMVGAMQHPLQQRAVVDGRPRGIGVLQPRMEVAAHKVETPLALLLGGRGGAEPYNELQADFDGDACGRGSFVGKGIIDPEAFLDATEGKLIPGCVLSHDLIEGELAGCARASDIALFEGHPSTLAGFCGRLHRWTRGDWQLLPYLLPVFPPPCRAPKAALDAGAKRKLWRNLFLSLVEPMRLILLLYAAGAGKPWLLLAALLLPEWPSLLGADRQSLAALLSRLMALPARAVTEADAIGRTLYRLLVSHQHLLQWTTAAQLQRPSVKPPMLFFYASMLTGGAAAALAFMPGSAWPACVCLAALWCSFPFWLPYLEQPYRPVERPTEYMREVLHRLAQSTLLFFETAMTDVDNALPPDNVQLEPNKGVSHRTSPTNIGLYLLSLLALERLRLLSPGDMAQRMSQTLDTLEKLPKWNGCPYNWYDTRTLEPLKPLFVSTVDCGNLAASLLCCAQGARVLLRELPSRYGDLPGRMDALTADMRLDRLYDADAELFYIGVDADKGAPENVHYDLLMSESRLTSFVAIMLGYAPVRHWYRLGRTRAHTRRGRTLLSYSGTMFEYMMPLLLQPLARGTLIWDATRAAMREQERCKYGGAFGISESGYYAFDPNLYYQYRAFGVPSLALSPARHQSVIAPYATLLCLPVNLKSAFANLLKLQTLGLEGPLGFFEAADFDPARVGDKQSFKIIRSHMAHHQGMIVCAICNALCDNYLQGLFMSLPRARAHRLLLEEKPAKGRAAIRHPLKRTPKEPSISPLHASRAPKPLAFPVDAHVLHGAGTTLAVDAQGGGYLSRDGLMLTRFEESCYLPSGPRFYLRDTQSGAYTRLPDPQSVKEARFETAQVVFTHEKYQTLATLRAFVNPLDGAVIHLISVENLAKTERMLEICSYLEPSLCARKDDEAHPAFRKLFLETGRIDPYGVYARRRPRDENEEMRELWHLLSADTSLMVCRAQTDRAAFLGRGRTVYAPRALELPVGAVADSLGAMIDPCLSLRAQFVLPASGKAQFAFVTLLPQGQDAPAAFLERYRQIESVARFYEPALTQGLVTARYLGLSPEEQNEISRLAGSLLYIGQPMQARYASANVLPLRGLWELGLGGDLPLWVVRCQSAKGLALVKLALKAHAYYRMSGLWSDLALVCDPAAEDGGALYDELNALMRANGAAELVDRDGGVRLWRREALSDGRYELVLAAARLVLDASGKSIAQQLDEQSASAYEKPVYAPKPSARWKAALPDGGELLYDNGFGGFDASSGDYVIALPPGRQTPAPWCNPLCSENFGTLAGESGLLFTYAGNSHAARLTRWPNDGVSPRGEENFYLKDAESKLLWSATRDPLGGAAAVRVRHAPGVTVYEASAYGIQSRLTCFADRDAPLGVRVLQLKNEDETDRLLTFCHACVFSMGLPASGWQLASAERADGAVVVTSPQMDGAACLCGVDPEPTMTTALSPGALEGLGGRLPMALCGEGAVASEAGSAAILSFTVQLKAGESRAITTALGFWPSRQRMARDLDTLRADGATLRLHQVRQYWERRLDALRFDLPDAALGLMLNRWLPYQVAASRLWMRAGLYQAGGAFGFRDQLQDMLSQLHTAPALARAHLLECAAHQFEQGDVQHWWHPPRYGVRTRISDDLLFLPYVTAEYVRATGDSGILNEEVGYLRDEPLRPDERERLGEPDVSPVREPLWLHCLRAIDHVSYGAHGLPLMGGGDWNDGMSLVGGENGESVWLGMFLCEVIRQFAPLCEPQTAQRLWVRREQLLRMLEKHAWDGAWYLRAWYSDGQKLGASQNDECRIDLLPQCWAVLCGLSRERGALAMDSVWRLLYERDIGVLKLFAPPFDGEEKPGYLAGYLPGVRENGGQYTHAVPWAIAAYHQLGSDDRAWELVRAILPINHAQTKQQSLRYRVEPYALAGDIYANPQQRGRGGWTWYTGSAGWLWTVVTQQLFGFQKVGNTLRLRPVVPESWDAFHLTYRYGTATYHLHATRDCPFAVADGERLTHGRLILLDDGRIHEATFPIRGSR